MPRYFFHVHDGSDFPDLQGTLLDNDDAAQIEAVRFSGDLLRDGAEKFWNGEEWSMRVTDNEDLTLFELMFTATCSPALENG